MNEATQQNKFVELAQINVNDHVEKKSNLSYLSWVWAVDQLMRKDPQANWEFHEPSQYGDTLMVSCTVTAFGKPITMHLPVMDHRNKAIVNPDAFQVNKNMMRCLVKAIACHGLGLYIYAGEDLPSDADGESQNKKPAKAANQPAPMSDSEVNYCINEMRICTDLEVLKGIFGGAYKRANDDQKATIKTAYDVCKDVLTTPSQEAA